MRSQACRRTSSASRFFLLRNLIRGCCVRDRRRWAHTTGDLELPSLPDNPTLPTPTRAKKINSGCVTSTPNAEDSWKRKGPVNIKRGLGLFQRCCHHRVLSQLRKTWLMAMIASVLNGKTMVPTVLAVPDQGADEKEQEILSYTRFHLEPNRYLCRDLLHK
jgi:hypothetical protein